MIGLIGFSLFAFALLWKVLKTGRREKFLPPGPPTVPLLGNLYNFPTKYAHIRFTEWAQTYGDVFSLKIASGTVLVLSSATAVKEIMDKKSGNTADRPPTFIGELVANGLHMALARYADTWRILRRTAHTILTPQGSEEHIPIQRAEAVQLMYDLLHDPLKFYTHIRRASNSGTLSVLYGKRCPRYESKDATDFFEVEEQWEMLQATGHTPPMDLLPILKYVPERWAAWKRECREVKKLQGELYYRLLEECEETVRKGEEVGCFMEEIIGRREEFGLTREMAAYLGGVLIEGGSDTTASFLQTLVLAFVAFPEAQRKAHEEMDRVVGSKFLPTLDDFPNLPYIQAIIKEVHRFRPGVPISVPHMSTADDEYLGYFIPKETTILMNTWGIYHDPKAFEEPEAFNPDRYILTEYGTKPGYDDSDFRHTLAFGSGRRICPGIHVANNALMLNVMFLVWAFNFDQAINPETKKPIPLDIYDYHAGLIAPPNPFKCSITPRSSHHAELIDREFTSVVNTFLPFEQKLDAIDKAWIAQRTASLQK